MLIILRLSFIRLCGFKAEYKGHLLSKNVKYCFWVDIAAGKWYNFNI